MMKRHMTYYLAVAAMLASGIAGTVGTTIPHVLGQQPIDRAVFDLAGFKTRSGGTEVSIAYHGGPARSSNLVLAEFNSTKVGTEVAY